MFRRHSHSHSNPSSKLSLLSNVIKRLSTSTVQQHTPIPAAASDVESSTPQSPSTTLVDPSRSATPHHRPEDTAPDTSGGVMMYSPLLPMNMDLVEIAESVPYTGADDQAPLGNPHWVPEVVSAAQEQEQSEKWGWLGARVRQGWSSFSLPWASQTQQDAGPSIGTNPGPNVIYSPDDPDYAQLPPAFSPLDLRSPLPNIYSPLPSLPQLPSSPQLVPLYLSDPQPTPAPNTEAPSHQGPRAWVPSRIKLSIQALWWGYRLYIPSPLMAHLSTRTLATAHRAQVLTTALTWFLQNIPVHTLPAPAQPPLLLLQQLAPWAGYLGAALAWGWTRVEAFDEGYGIILTATWLVPFVLVPATWWETDFLLSPALAGAGLPPEHAPPMYSITSLASAGAAMLGDDRATEVVSGSSPGPSSLLPPPYDTRSGVLSPEGSSMLVAMPRSPLMTAPRISSTHIPGPPPVPPPPPTSPTLSSSSPRPSLSYFPESSFTPSTPASESPPPTPSSPEQFFSAPSSPITNPTQLAPHSFTTALSPPHVHMEMYQDTHQPAQVASPLMHGRIPDTGVSPGSPLVHALLRGPVLRSVPLPNVTRECTRRKRGDDDWAGKSAGKGGASRRSARV